ncbi:MAG: cobyrinate a,c-diamide synthase, partial [Actinobacteria bacterium]|nr:cobyrinate a,c-diamide synthase [Actinomycetota bacterium]
MIAGVARLGPRLVVAGTASGVGKTTVATGLMAALRRRGTAVASAKVGPDFIDPGYHALATGRPGRNLDPWMCGEETMAPLAARAGEGADVLVIEGVMGCFDGALTPRFEGDAPPGDLASTASVARLLEAPVVLVVDAGGMSRSVAAVVQGFRDFDDRLRLGGVVLNRVGSAGHEAALRSALEPLGVPVLGALHRDDHLAWRDRHLGLVPVAEQPEQVRQSLDRLAAIVDASVDLDAVVRLAASAPALVTEAPPAARPVGRARVAVAGGPAFSFSYPDNLELLAAAGAELLPFDPCTDPALPEGATGLVAGGGFPEVFAGALAANRPLLDDVRRRVAAGLVTWAECGGLLWLSRSLDGNRLAGALPGDGHMTGRLSLGYRRATLRRDSPLGPAGTALWGHEFHYSDLAPAGDGLDLSGRHGRATAGWASPTLVASYLHLHLG